MCEIILEAFSKMFINNTNNIVKWSSRTMKDLKGEKIDGAITYNLEEIQNIPDIIEFVKLLIERNEYVKLLKENLDKEYIRNIDIIKLLNKIKKGKKINKVKINKNNY
ncbi:hypothetical protein LCGC14_1344710 [marine sediment metagenome]|uniref:Uncharacterized protein n=1 Tax=marine sediment metagenome TaxID=412755 RepID=A0A0F9MTK0_9ZZZZ